MRENVEIKWLGIIKYFWVDNKDPDHQKLVDEGIKFGRQHIERQIVNELTPYQIEAVLRQALPLLDDDTVGMLTIKLCSLKRPRRIAQDAH